MVVYEQSFIFTGIIKSILEDSSASKDKSNPSKRKSSTAVFHVKPEEISLVTIPGKVAE